MQCIDTNDREASLQLLPQPPILTSRDADWEDIILECHRTSAAEYPEHCFKQHLLIVHLKEYRPGTERRLGDLYQRENPVVGDVVVIPARVNHSVIDVREGEILALSLEPRLVSNIALESIDPDRVEILPTFSQSDSFIYQVSLALIKELETQKESLDGKVANSTDRLYVEYLRNGLATHLLKNYSTRQPKLKEYSDGLPPDRLRLAIEFINDRLEQDIKLADIAQIVNISQYYFSRLFKQSMGVTPYQYVIQQRVEKAKQLLKQKDLSIADIALRCGFNSQSHLTFCFRRATGVTPKVYQDI